MKQKEKLKFLVENFSISKMSKENEKHSHLKKVKRRIFLMKAKEKRKTQNPYKDHITKICSATQSSCRYIGGATRLCGSGVY